jgi:penicillin amidase
VALREGALNTALLRMETAASVEAAQAIAPEAGIPNQNLVAADAKGHIGWTIIGRIPRRFGHDGRLPSSWADGTRGWDGWLAPAEYPRILDPPSGRIFSANARMVSGEKLARIGFGGYVLGARQRQIRDDLLAIRGATEADMLRVQLDDRALFLERWQKLLLNVLSPQAIAGNPRRSEARRLVEAWGAQAAVASAGYRIVRGFRERAAEEALAPLLAPCRSADPGFDYLGSHEAKRAFRQWEGPAWALVSQRPAHLLDPRFESWDSLLLAALDSVLDELGEGGGRLAERTWGERNTTAIQHPLSLAVPGLAWLLDMRRQALPGDGNMPRVQTPSEGASERFAVSPGHEERGYFHMPAGQSGHPLSSHYADGHEAWVKGEPTPFLPGPAVSVLTLQPAR